jgi:hypothetical protein
MAPAARQRVGFGEAPSKHSGAPTVQPGDDTGRRDNSGGDLTALGLKILPFARPPARLRGRGGEIANRQGDTALTINSAMIIIARGDCWNSIR